jgi:hypothetical protein
VLTAEYLLAARCAPPGLVYGLPISFARRQGSFNHICKPELTELLCGATLAVAAVRSKQGAVMKSNPLVSSKEPEVSMQAVAAMVDVAEEIRHFVPTETSSASEPADEAALHGGDVASLVQKITAKSTAEMERLIGELQQARDHLQSEGERIEREVAHHVALSQTALESVKIISETVGEWRKAGHPLRGTYGPTADDRIVGRALGARH